MLPSLRPKTNTPLVHYRSQQRDAECWTDLNYSVWIHENGGSMLPICGVFFKYFLNNDAAQYIKLWLQLGLTRLQALFIIGLVFSWLSFGRETTRDRCQLYLCKPCLLSVAKLMLTLSAGKWKHRLSACKQREWSVLNKETLPQNRRCFQGCRCHFVQFFHPIFLLLSWLNCYSLQKEILGRRPGCTKRERKREVEREKERRQEGEGKGREGPGVVYISCLLTWLCGQAANRTQGKEQVVLVLCLPLWLRFSKRLPPLLSSSLLSLSFQSISLLSHSLALSLARTEQKQSATFPPPHTYFHNTCLSLFVLKATDILFISSPFFSLFDHLMLEKAI